MSVNFHDLPPDVREKLAASGAVAPARPRRPKDRTTMSAGPDGLWECHRCHVRFTRWGGKQGAEQHGRSSGHARLEIVLPPLAQTP